MRLHQKLCETGAFSGARSNTGRAKSNRTVAVEDKILDMVAEHPNTSTRAVASQIEVSPSTTWRVLKDESMHPFHVQRVQELNQRDFPRRMDFARWYLQKNTLNPDFGATVLFKDECTFTPARTFN